MVLTRIFAFGLGLLTPGCLWKLYEPEPKVSPMTVTVDVRTGDPTSESCMFFGITLYVQRCVEDPASHDSVCEPPPDLTVRMGPPGGEVPLNPSFPPGEYYRCAETQPDRWSIDIEGEDEHFHVEMPALALVEVKPVPNGVSWTPSGDPEVTMDFGTTLANTPDDGYEDLSAMLPSPPYPYPYSVDILRRKRAPQTPTFTGVIMQYTTVTFEPSPP